MQITSSMFIYTFNGWKFPSVYNDIQCPYTVYIYQFYYYIPLIKSTFETNIESTYITAKVYSTIDKDSSSILPQEQSNGSGRESHCNNFYILTA